MTAHAWASPHVHKGVNPFEQSGHEHKLHCSQHGHDLAVPCPHHDSKPLECGISRDCGGQPQGTVPAAAFSQSPLERIALHVRTFFPGGGMRLSAHPFPVYSLLLPDLSDPPPRSF